jgi:hypothetical protein
MAYPATKTVIAERHLQPGSDDQSYRLSWKWGYDYLQEGISLQLSRHRAISPEGSTQGRALSLEATTRW